MKYFLPLLFILLFLYFNLKILISDIRAKIIPNKYLIYLLCILPFYYLYLIFFLGFYPNLLIIILSLFVTFLLYYFGIWGAGDAKYLLVLSLFIQNVGIIPFIGNIAILVTIYLFSYFLYFYFGKSLIFPKYGISLYKNIYNDLKDKFLVHITNYEGEIKPKSSIKILLNRLLTFLFFFVGVRLTRLIFMSTFFSSKENSSYFGDLLKNYHIYLGLFMFVLFFGLRYMFKEFFNSARKFLFKKFGIKADKTKILFPLILSLLLLLIISYEYIVNPYEMGKFFYKLFTVYIGLFIISKILLYFYKLTFNIKETYYLDIGDLKEGEIVDKDYLIKLFSHQSCLRYGGEIGFLSPNPQLFFSKIENPIDKDTCEKLVEIYKIVNDYHTNNKSPIFQENKKIKVFKTFAFAPYIFSGFILTYFFQDNIFKFIFSFFGDIFKSFFH
ncbi:MAG: hypothetical protein PHN31_06895 [Candidatus Gracilibacteria bacterium]|nr:hypothetical protein [Candidatus Gracilibacteria bacterium]